MGIYWEEDDKRDPFVVPDDIVDVSFVVSGRMLPNDHAEALHDAILSVLPWFDEEDGTGLHLIHVAESANGWERPSDPDALMHLSRRTRMTLRLPQHRVEEVRAALSGTELEVGGHTLVPGKSAVKKLSPLGTIFARYVAAEQPMEEPEFLDWMHGELRDMGVRARKMMCGKAHDLRLPGGPVQTRSVMLADLSPEDSVRVQQRGIGPWRRHGCGLFLPHKGIKPVGKEAEKQHFAG